MSNVLVVSLGLGKEESKADANATSTQGSTYHRIIESVIENCHVTFEEEGVEKSTLDDLRTVS